jgi:choline dehydrogenase
MEEWHKRVGAGWSPADLQARFDRLDALGIKTSPPDDWQPFQKAFADSAALLGNGWCGDFNANGAEGVGPIPLIADGSGVTNVLTAYLNGARNNPNLEIRLGARVVRILFKGYTALGAEIETAGGREKILADEVVLCAGAIGSAEVMLQSGVGAHERTEIAGVKTVLPLRGVGENLMDHPVAWIRTTLEKGRGKDSGNAFRVLLRKWAESDDSGDFAWEAFHDFTAPSPEARMATGIIACMLLNPEGRGTVGLHPRNASRGPAILLGMGSVRDREAMARGLAYGTGLLSTPPMSAVASGKPVFVRWSRNPEPPLDRLPEIGEMDAFMNTGHHLHGTCRMGTSADEGAVVDGGFRVHGIKNLYVCDASVIPVQLRVNTHLTTLMLAETLVRQLSP